jgi:hypothetical protein
MLFNVVPALSCTFTIMEFYCSCPFRIFNEKIKKEFKTSYILCGNKNKNEKKNASFIILLLVALKLILKLVFSHRKYPCITSPRRQCHGRFLVLSIDED